MCFTHQQIQFPAPNMNRVALHVVGVHDDMSRDRLANDTRYRHSFHAVVAAIADSFCSLLEHSSSIVDIDGGVDVVADDVAVGAGPYCK